LRTPGSPCYVPDGGGKQRIGICCCEEEDLVGRQRGWLGMAVSEDGRTTVNS